MIYIFYSTDWNLGQFSLRILDYFFFFKNILFTDDEDRRGAEA